MKRRDELVVGVTVFSALVLVIAGAIWLSQADLPRGGTFNIHSVPGDGTIVTSVHSLKPNE